MTPEAADYLAKAREYLNKARSLLDVMHYSDEAARAAYLAAFHAAQALVFERTARVAKSHSGLRTTFARLAKDDPRIDRPFTRFLARVYKSKEITDYGIGPQAVVTAAEAQEMIDLAMRFVDRMAEIVGYPVPGSQFGGSRPAMLRMWMFPVALACGNTFVLRPSERDLPRLPHRQEPHGRDAGRRSRPGDRRIDGRRLRVGRRALHGGVSRAEIREMPAMPRCGKRPHCCAGGRTRRAAATSKGN